MANSRSFGATLVVLAALVCCKSPASATEAGQVAAILGELRIERGVPGDGPAVPGTTIQEGDRLRTGAADRAKIVLADHSVVDIAPLTEIVVKRQASDLATGRIDSLIELVQGKIRARLETRDGQALARYQVETPTAVVIHGTDFIVQHDPERVQTHVVGIRDVAEVVGRLAVVGGAVKVGSQAVTVVQKGRFPVAPSAVPLDEYQRYLQGFTIVGTGASDSLAVGHPAITGRLLSPRDLPGAHVEDVDTAPYGDLEVGAPREFLAEEMSPDFRVHDQPLLEYERQQPGLPLPAGKGGVIVEF